MALVAERSARLRSRLRATGGCLPRRRHGHAPALGPRLAEPAPSRPDTQARPLPVRRPHPGRLPLRPVQQHRGQASWPRRTSLSSRAVRPRGEEQVEVAGERIVLRPGVRCCGAATNRCASGAARGCTNGRCSCRRRGSRGLDRPVGGLPTRPPSDSRPHRWGRRCARPRRWAERFGHADRRRRRSTCSPVALPRSRGPVSHRRTRRGGGSPRACRGSCATRASPRRRWRPAGLRSSVRSLLRPRSRRAGRPRPGTCADAPAGRLPTGSWCAVAPQVSVARGRACRGFGGPGPPSVRGQLRVRVRPDPETTCGGAAPSGSCRRPAAGAVELTPLGSPIGRAGRCGAPLGSWRG